LFKINWNNRLEILSKTKSAEEKLLYLLHCIKEKWSMRDLRRQLSSGYFERTMLSDKKLPAAKNLPKSAFKDPYGEGRLKKAGKNGKGSAI
jgi:predicted nuclease of restriction endonuclease-like (RecB) superfamily